MSIGPVTSTLAVASDAVTLPVFGAEYGTARVSFSGTATCTLTFEMSVDGGTNWVASPLAKRVDAVSANPTVAATYGPAGAISGVTYEIPLPGDCTHVRARVSSYTSGTLVANATPGRPYVPGSVVAVLAEAPLANATLTVGPLETGGWTNLQYTIVIGSATSGAVNVNCVDDLGNSNVLVGAASLATGTYTGGLGPGTVVGGTTLPWGSLVNNATTMQVPKRLTMVATVATTSTQRIRLEARR